MAKKPGIGVRFCSARLALVGDIYSIYSLPRMGFDPVLAKVLEVTFMEILTVELSDDEYEDKHATMPGRVSSCDFLSNLKDSQATCEPKEAPWLETDQQMLEAMAVNGLRPRQQGYAQDWPGVAQLKSRLNMDDG